ncbi:MAG: nucleotidyltransferase, partial [Clostridiales bacterium]|nr:nucleotidyltransferase [Clostridiales bacterium]
GWLVDIVETSGIIKDGNHAKAKSAEGSDFVIDLDSSVSMNMWGFKPSVFEELEKGFKEFLTNLSPEDIKKEYLLPELVGNLVHSNVAKVKVLKTSDRWFGVTYKEDKASVTSSIKKLIESGAYPDLE